MSTHLPIAVDENTHLYLPRETLSELLEARGETQRADAAINFLGNWGNFGVPMYGLGNQPTDESLLRQIQAYAAISGEAIASRVRGLKYYAVRDITGADGQTTTERVTNHPLADVLKKPNPVFTTGSMLWLTAYHLKFIGQSFWQKLKDDRGVTRELWPLLAQNVDIIPSQTDVIGGYMVRDGQGRQIPLMPDEVVRFWRPDPLTLYSALGSFGPQQQAWDTSQYLEQHMTSHFKNNATPRVAMVARDTLQSVPTLDERDDFRRKWSNDYNSRTGRFPGAPAFVPSGFDVQELSAHGGTTDLVPLSDQRRDQILAAFGVPGSIVGMVQDVNRAAAETNAYVFDKNTIHPLTMLIEEALTDQLAMDWAGENLRVAFEDFIAQDKEHNLRRDEVDAKYAIRSGNEIRADRNEENEPAPWADLPIQPLGMGPYDGVPMGDDGFEDADDLRLPPRAEAPAAAKPAPVPALTREEIDDLERAEIRARKAHTKSMLPPIQRILRAQQSDIAGRVRELPENSFGRGEAASPRADEDIAAQIAAEEAKAAATAAAARFAEALFDPAEWVDVFRAQVDPVRTEIFTTEARRAYFQFGEGRYTLTGRAQAKMASQSIKLSGNTGKSTMRKLRTILTNGILDGDGPEAMARRIESAAAFGQKRARTIARTELLTSMQSGKVDGWRETGVIEKSRWNISGINTRDTHEAMVWHEPVLLGGMFDVGGYPAENPGDESLPPEERVNCNCFLTSVVPGSEGEG